VPDRVEPGTVDFRLDFYVKDFLAATQFMSGPEAAAYALSLLVAWPNGATLPADPDAIRRAMRYESGEWAKVWPALAEKWPLSADKKRRTNARLTRELARAKDRAARARNDGRRGAEVRWGSASKPAPAAAPDRVANRVAIAVPVPVPVLPSLTSNGVPTSEEPPARKRAVRFVPPTRSEISGYAIEKGWTAADWNTDAFFEFYGGKGWKIGKAPMVDWRLTACRAHREGWTTKGNGHAVPLDPENAAARAVANKKALSDARAKMRAQGMNPDDD
jgi:uncharacterized protein YdaU (DUF1376 family)